jgi:hypothetical protein
VPFSSTSARSHASITGAYAAIARFPASAFYLENVHGLDPIAAGLHLLPMTAMLIVGSLIAGR